MRRNKRCLGRESPLYPWLQVLLLTLAGAELDVHASPGAWRAAAHEAAAYLMGTAIRPVSPILALSGCPAASSLTWHLRRGHLPRIHRHWTHKGQCGSRRPALRALVVQLRRVSSWGAAGGPAVNMHFTR